MSKNEVAFIMASINVRGIKNVSELRCKLNPDNKNEKILLDYLEYLERST